MQPPVSRMFQHLCLLQGLCFLLAGVAAKPVFLCTSQVHGRRELIMKNRYKKGLSALMLFVAITGR